jgi:hypothetical protein
VNLLSSRRISLCGLKNKGSLRKNFDVMERLISVEVARFPRGVG